MATRDDRNVFQRLREMGEEQVNRVLEELMSSPRFADILGKTIQQAMATKGTMDRNMQTILSLLNLPSKADYKKLATKIEALQGSLVNLNIKLDRMLAEGGFSSARDIAAITVNRWPHGYSYVANSLYDEDDYESVLERARQKVGRVAIANSDAAGDAYAHLAIAEAARAVSELAG